MREDEMNCLKCDGAMEEGFIMDLTVGGAGQKQWGKGKPKRTFIAGDVPSSGLRFKVTTYRCCKCGFLEDYADLG